jgi:hypothetical protein
MGNTIDWQGEIDRLRNAAEARKMADIQNEDEFTADDARPLIPEGIYDVFCTGVEKGVAHFASLKMYLKFKIVNPGQYMDTKLFMAINLINIKTGKPFKKVPRGSKYYQQWVIANGNSKPVRDDRMSPKIFVNRIFKAVVKTVKPKFPDGTEMPECFYYSVIEYLKERVA